MEDTLEQRIMKSNLSDDDKIELIKRLNQQVVYTLIRGTDLLNHISILTRSHVRL